MVDARNVFRTVSPMFPALLLAAWLGVTLFVWFSANTTFSVLAPKKNPAIAQKFGQIPEPARERALRHAAGEVNRAMFRGWNRAQLVLAALVFWGAFSVRNGGAGRRRWLLGISGALLAIVAAHAFWLGPGIEEAGRALDIAGRSRAPGAARRMGFYHGAYVVSDMVKAALIALGLWFIVRESQSD